MGYALSSVFNHETTAVAFAPIVNMPLNLLGGYMINLKGIFSQAPQRYIAWLMYFSPVRYGFSALMIKEFGPYAKKTITKDPDTGDEVIEYNAAAHILYDYGFEETNFWVCVLALFLLFIMFRALVVLSLVLQDRKKAANGNDTRNTTI